MSEWTLSYEGYDPKFEGLRETLCTLGNGYMASRGAAANALADDTHYPGTYLAGGYNRLTTEVAGHEVENEDLVNIPNWLPLVFRIDDGPWLRPQEVEVQDYRLALSIHDGVLSRALRLKDAEGRSTLWEERRFVSMACPHLAAIEVKLTAENWSGRMSLRSAIDGSVINSGVPRYRDLSSRHLEPLETQQMSDEIVLLRSRMVQSRREIATAARTRLYRDGALLESARELERLPDFVAQNIDCDMAQGQAVTVEKVAAVCTSKDMGITEPGATATKLLENAAAFEKLLQAHCRNWKHLWEECGIEIETTANSQVEMKLNLHIFHLLQTVSMHSVDLDAGVPPRGWTGEAYRGHIMWDELFIFPFLNLRKPVLTRTLLRYRHRRLPEARRAAREAGHRGAMFPWQSGSDGREESQKFHLNPMSGRWIADTSNRQRHVNAAIAFNVWQYYEVTEDREFLYDFGAELMLEIARFWSSIASYDENSGRYSIRGVMGPDEFHTAYPGKDASADGGLDNNAYTNVMVSWLMTRTLDMLDLLPGPRRRELFDALEISPEELREWEDISRNLVIPIDSDGVIALDARIRLDTSSGDEATGKPSGSARLAIRPYPKALEQTFTLPDGQKIFLRPLRPDDAPGLRAGFKRLDPQDVRMRFFAQMSEMTPAMAARLTQLDYNREMALAAFPAEGPDRAGLGIVRLVADPDNQRGEFAITIRSDVKGRGLGRALMERIMDFAVKRGIGEIWGDVLADNHRMLALCEELGFERRPPEDGIVHVRRPLRGTA